MTAPIAIIVDIDGTLADNTHRQHHVTGNPKDWDNFFDGIDDDIPNNWCRDIVHAMRILKYEIIFVTGRSDHYLTRTILWIEKHLPGFSNYQIYTRAANDHREDTVVKAEIYKKHIENKFNVLFCLDDRPSVCRMWRGLGLTVLQCNDKEF